MAAILSFFPGKKQNHGSIELSEKYDKKNNAMVHGYLE